MTENSGNIIVLTERDKLLAIISEFAGEHRISCPEQGSSFHSIRCLREKTAASGGTSWIKKDLVDLIKTRGAPVMFIADLRIDSGMDNDHDRMKVLRTIILSYIIITHSEAFRDLACNIFLLADSDDYQRFRNEIKEPEALLNHIKTNDAKVNDLILQLKNDTGRFSRIFNIFLCRSESDGGRIKAELNTFLNMIKAREKLKQKVKKPENEAQPENRASAPADIVFRFGSSFYVNGEVLDSYGGEKDLEQEEIYIIGNFTSFTRVEVIDRLLKLLRSGPTREYSFRKKPEIILHIPEDTVIDVTIPVTLAQLLSKELYEYRDFRIKTTMRQSKIMQQSKGYTMIQRNLLIRGE